ncbi:unnamed protein product [Symbiodinium natans]|uniref:Uncharacterized protein n=1 Tax=Symbiodinium natans TaxID=878477 RepID=A0A812TM83_9DINO|nr:unnamed protein product [Symbiodinium natans]
MLSSRVSVSSVPDKSTLAPESEHQLAIHQLNELYGAITSCTDKLQTQHDTCRTEEAAAKGFLLNAQVEYEALTNPPQPCYGQFNDGLLGKLEDHEVMMSCIEKIQDWAKALRSGGPRKKSNYDKAKERYIKKLASCSSLQHQFESSFCELRTTVDDSCTSLTTCFEQNLAIWEKSKPDFKTLEGSRKATFQAAEKVLCLVTEMLKPVVKEADIAKCDKLMVDTSSLTLPAFRKAPPAPICDTSAVATFPCEKGFLPLYYTGQDWYDAAPTDPCTPCTFSPSTTATTTGTNPPP